MSNWCSFNVLAAPLYLQTGRGCNLNQKILISPDRSHPIYSAHAYLLSKFRSYHTTRQRCLNMLGSQGEDGEFLFPDSWLDIVHCVKRNDWQVTELVREWTLSKRNLICWTLQLCLGLSVSSREKTSPGKWRVLYCSSIMRDGERCAGCERERVRASTPPPWSPSDTATVSS